MLKLPLTFCRFAIGGLFSTNVHSEHSTFINHKAVCGARNPAYCKDAVSGSFPFNFQDIFHRPFYLSQFLKVLAV